MGSELWTSSAGAAAGAAEFGRRLPQVRGVRRVVDRRDGVFPDGFYSTTNLPTKVRLDGRWYDVVNPEMDCGLVVEEDADGPRVITRPSGM